MDSRFEVEVTVTSARDLKNVNWRHGDLRPYAVLWVEGGPKCSTKVAVDGDVNPIFEEKVTLPVPRRPEDCTLYVDLVHARSEGEEDTKPLIGSARLPLRDVLEEVGIGGGKLERTLKLKRPSGRPHGKIDLRVAIRDPQRYYDRYAAAPPPPYGQPAGSRDYYAPPPPPQPAYYGGGYGQQQSYGAAAAPPVGYPYSAPPAPVAYGGVIPPPVVYGGGAPAPMAYGGGVPAQMYGGSQSSGGYVEEQKKKKSGMGVGTGLAVGAVAGVLGGLALAEGVDYVEDKIEDDVAERVEDDLAYEDGGYDDF